MDLVSKPKEIQTEAQPIPPVEAAIDVGSLGSIMPQVTPEVSQPQAEPATEQTQPTTPTETNPVAAEVGETEPQKETIIISEEDINRAPSNFDNLTKLEDTIGNVIEAGNQEEKGEQRG